MVKFIKSVLTVGKRSPIYDLKENALCKWRCDFAVKWAIHSEVFMCWLTSRDGMSTRNLPHAHTEMQVHACMHTQIQRKYCKHIHMKVLWQQALKARSMLGRREGVPLWFFWVWWSWWTDNTGHMKHKDSEEMLSGVTLFEVYSHIHTVMKEKSKKR